MMKQNCSHTVFATCKDAAELTEQSPVTYASDVKIPLMLVHGMHDDRVPYTHMRTLRGVLDKAGIAYEGYFPTNETHGIYGEKNQRKYYQEVLALLERSLAGTQAK